MPDLPKSRMAISVASAVPYTEQKVTPTSAVVSTLVMSSCSAEKGDSSPSSSASRLTFHGQSVVMAVSAPASSAAVEKSAAQSKRRPSKSRVLRGTSGTTAAPIPALAKAAVHRASTAATGSTSRNGAAAPRKSLPFACDRGVIRRSRRSGCHRGSSASDAAARAATGAHLPLAHALWRSAGLTPAERIADVCSG